MLIKYIDTKKNLWAQFLDTCIFAYNTSAHESTKFSPFELMFGRKAVLPIDINMGSSDPAAILEEYNHCQELSPSNVQEETELKNTVLEEAKAKNENHWITVSTIGCPPSTINVYDSLHGTVSMHTQRVVADILQSQKAAISFQLQDVQWQGNEWDCGLFALANATTLCNGMDPCTVVYLQSAMRQHFLDSIECGFLAPFPLKKKRQNHASST